MILLRGRNVKRRTIKWNNKSGIWFLRLFMRNFAANVNVLRDAPFRTLQVYNTKVLLRKIWIIMSSRKQANKMEFMIKCLLLPNYTNVMNYHDGDYSFIFFPIIWHLSFLISSVLVSNSLVPISNISVLHIQSLTTLQRFCNVIIR